MNKEFNIKEEIDNIYINIGGEDFLKYHHYKEEERKEKIKDRRPRRYNAGPVPYILDVIEEYARKEYEEYKKELNII